MITKGKHADEIREMWQSKALRASKGKLRKVIIVALAKEYPAALVTLMKVTFPGFVDFDRPFFSSYAHIDLGGNIVCDMIDRDGSKVQAQIGTEDSFIYAVRKLADELKLPDKDRSEMFVVLQKWVASDKRVDQQGRKLAS
jgi:hypothetical protein